MNSYDHLENCLTARTYFLEVSGLAVFVSKFIIEMENISVLKIHHKKAIQNSIYVEEKNGYKYI